MWKKSVVAVCLICGLTLIGKGQVASPFKAAVANGKITTSAINEASGLVASVANMGALWTHNDSGDEARIFLIDDSARCRATFYLEGVRARDWEDIAMMNQAGKNYLMVGDIGDNKAKHAAITIHVFEEPKIDKHQTVVLDTVPATAIQHFVFQYEDGPRDAESIFFDPVDRWLYVITKREMRVGLYGIRWSEVKVGDTLVLRKQATLPLTFVTAADIRADGSEVLVKNLLTIYYWQRRPGESIAACLLRQATILPYQPEPQGEAIAFSRNNDGYYTLSEAALGLSPVLYFYQRQR